MSDLIKRKSRAKHTSVRLKGQLKYPNVLEQPRVAIQRMRAVVGALLYMTDTEVNRIFIDQVNRIGTQLENLENALAENPRTKQTNITNAENEIETITVSFNKWEPLNLKKKWFDYMDKIYREANSKATKFMDDTFKKMDDEYDSKNMIKQADIDKEKDRDKQRKMQEEKRLREDMKEYIPKLKTEWKRANNWPKPQWN